MKQLGERKCPALNIIHEMFHSEWFEWLNLYRKAQNYYKDKFDGVIKCR